MNNPFAGLDNITPEPSAQPPSAPLPPSETHWKPSLPNTPPPQSKRWLWWTVGGVIVLGLVSGGYFAYSRGYLSIPFLMPKSGGLFEKMIESISDIKSAQYSLRVNLTAEQRQANAQPLFTKKDTNINGSLFGDDTGGLAAGLLSLYDPDTILKSVPADIKFDGGVSFSFEADKKLEDSDALLKFDGTYSGSDSSVAVDLEARKIGKNVYGVINKFPSFFFIDVSALKGKWVIITPEDDAGIISDTTFEQTDTKQAVDKLQSGLRTALQKGVFTVNRQLAPETVAGVRSEHYRIVFHSNELPEVYQALISERQSKSEDTKQLQGILDNLKKQETADLLKRVADNSVFDIWVDRINGMLRQAQWTLTVVPPSDIEKLKDKQFRIQLKLTLEHVNEKIKVDQPSPTIPYDEADRLLSGKTKEEQLAQKQISRARQLQQVLNAYQKAAGSYPDSLDQLTPKMRELNEGCKQRAEQRKVNANANKNASNTSGYPTYDYETDYNCYLYSSYEKKPVNVTDAYTGKPYTYAKDGDDFKTTYEMRLGDTDQLSYEKQSYAEGTNTMTSKDVSIEKETSYEKSQRERSTNANTNSNTNTALKTTDTDGDQLSDTLEQTVYGTNHTKQDSDDDGYSDSAEILKQYNPNGSGRPSEAQLRAWNAPGNNKSLYRSNYSISSTNGNATVTWTTNQNSTGIVRYGTTQTLDQSATEDRVWNLHAVSFSVTPGIQYYYSLYSCTPLPDPVCEYPDVSTFQAK